METLAYIDSRRYTVEEYFELAEKSETKLDYFDGRIIDMAGATFDHNTIVANLIVELGTALKGKPCRVVGSDQRLQAHRNTLYTYPDVQIVCGEPEFAANDSSRMNLVNPKVVFEVLSPSTEVYDRGDKLKNYVALPSLVEYVLVSQKSPRVEIFQRRHEGNWLFSWVEGLDATLHLQSIDVRVPLSEIYRNVTFEAGMDS